MSIDLSRQLAAFEAADLVRLVQDWPDAEYWFKHSLIQETVYAGLLRPARAELHRRVAEAIEALPPGDEDTRSAVLALHYERAGMAPQAIAYAAQAGDRARRRHANREAVAFYDRAIALAEANTDSGLKAQIHKLYGARGQARQAIGDHNAALADYEAMWAGARADGSIEDKAEALTFLVTMRILLHGLNPTVEAELTEALELARQSGDRWLETRALWNIGLAHRFHNPALAQASLEQAVAMAKQEPGDRRLQELQGYALNDLAIVQFNAGQFRKVLVSAEAAVAIFRSLNHPSMLADALGSVAMVHYLRGEPEAAHRTATEGRTLAEEIDNPWGIAYNNMTLTPLALDSGQLGKALSLAEETKTNAQRVGFPIFIGDGHAFACRVYRELDDTPAAVREAVAGANAFESTGAPAWTAMALGLRAQAAIMAGNALEGWQSIEDLAKDSPMRQTDLEGIVLAAPAIAETAYAAGQYEQGLRFCNWLMSVLMPGVREEEVLRQWGEVCLWRARLHLQAGGRSEALRDFGAAEETLIRSNAPLIAWQAAAGAAQVYEAAGDAASAAPALTRSRALILQVLDAAGDAQMREKFAARPDVSNILRV